MNIYILVFKMLIRQILQEVIDALAVFFRQLLRILFFGEDPFHHQEEANYSEPTA